MKQRNNLSCILLENTNALIKTGWEDECHLPCSKQPEQSQQSQARPWSSSQSKQGKQKPNKHNIQNAQP